MALNVSFYGKTIFITFTYLNAGVQCYLLSRRTVAVGCNPAELLLPIQLAVVVLIVQVLEPHGLLDLPP